jgi:cell division protein FtsB
MVWGGAGLFLSYLLFFLVFGRMGLIAHLRLSEEAARIDAEVARAQDEIALLADEVDALNHDPHTIERLARERLGMVRPGETVFLFPPPAPADAPARDDPPAP